MKTNCGSALDLFNNAFFDTKSTMTTYSEEDEQFESDKEKKSDSDFYVIPNPNEGKFTVHLVSNSTNSEVKIFNALGQLVEFTNINKLGDHTVNFDNIAKGQYTVVYIENGKIVYSEKLLVK